MTSLELIKKAYERGLSHSQVLSITLRDDNKWQQSLKDDVAVRQVTPITQNRLCISHIFLSTRVMAFYAIIKLYCQRS